MKKTTGLKDMKQRKRKIAALVATVMALGGVGTVMAVNQGTLAYFTDYDHEKNIFTTGKVDIDLTEPNWPGNQDVVPGDIFTKDPTITNKDSVPVCAYLQVKVPVANVTMVNDDGSRTPKRQIISCLHMVAEKLQIQCQVQRLRWMRNMDW